MASTSAPRGGGDVPSASGIMTTSASMLCSENQSLIVEMRKVFNMMKEIAVDLERENESAKVNELENTVAELLATYEDCTYQTSAIESVGSTYQPGAELTDFKKLLNDEFVKFKGNKSSAPQNHPLLRQFREAVWNVHHSGQPMPGEEHEDIVMTSTQSTILNITCPLSGKPITELAEPVRGYCMFTSNLSSYSSPVRIIKIAELFKMEAFVDLTLFLTFQNLSCLLFPWSSVDCKHVYEKKAIMGYISVNAQAKCPVTGIPYSPVLFCEFDVRV
ncbi:E3 SUMO-protein ligase MMS21 [Populus alba x Populus x berolinensis]|nr:E3 SUMO-protein ligase MMS21 [Populus alba x Populus x berolinensis]